MIIAHNVCVYDALGLGAFVKWRRNDKRDQSKVSTVTKLNKETKLYSYTKPQGDINTLLCAGRFCPTVVYNRVWVVSWKWLCLTSLCRPTSLGQTEPSSAPVIEFACGVKFSPARRICLRNPKNSFDSILLLLPCQTEKNLRFAQSDLLVCLFLSLVAFEKESA